MANIRIEDIDKALSSHGGLFLFEKLFEKIKNVYLLEGDLPTLKSGASRSIQKLKNLLMGFGAGIDCLDDMAAMSRDAGFLEVCDQTSYTPKSYGDFLRGFSGLQAKKLTHSLSHQSYALRERMGSKQKSITIDLDSTPNVQCGKKMEGVAFNYKNQWCLDTLHAFDEFGFQYWSDVRPGNTYSSDGAVEAVHHIFNNMPKTVHYKKIRRYARGDSAFCRTDLFNAFAAKNVGFVVCLKRNMLDPLLGQIRHWKKPKHKKREIRFYDDRDCELAETLYRPKKAVEILRVVVMRAVKKGREGLLFKQQEDYDYYSFISNIGEHELSSEKLIRFYRKRGQAENFIKEMKYGYDLLHYPCLKLIANKVWSSIAAMAHNFLRALAIAENPQKTSYAKRIRTRLIHIPCQVVRHAGQVWFRFMTHHYREVERWKKYLQQVQCGFV